MRFVLSGALPGADPSQDTNSASIATRESADLSEIDAEVCGDADVLDETLLVNRFNRGIANVVVYLAPSTGAETVTPPPVEGKEVDFKIDRCRFRPHVLVARVGDTLQIENKDLVGHNASLLFIRNESRVGMILPTNRQKRIELREAEPAPASITCNVHPWMQAYLLVLDHPYAGISDANGHLVIRNLPERELTFRAWAESADGPLRTVDVNGKQRHWPRNQFSCDINAGENDLGTVTLTLDNLSNPQ